MDKEVIYNMEPDSNGVYRAVNKISVHQKSMKQIRVVIRRPPPVQQGIEQFISLVDQGVRYINRLTNILDKLR